MDDNEEIVTRETLHRALIIVQQTMDNLNAKVDRLLEEGDSQVLAVRRQFQGLTSRTGRYARKIGSVRSTNGEIGARLAAINQSKSTNQQSVHTR